jgi:hypothetical protein
VLALATAVGLMVLLAAVATTGRGAPEDQRRVRLLREQIWMFHDSQTPPALPASLQALVATPEDELAYARPGDLRDARGLPIGYELRGEHSFVLRAAGPDGALGTPDDITWEE